MRIGNQQFGYRNEIVVQSKYIRIIVMLEFLLCTVTIRTYIMIVIPA